MEFYFRYTLPSAKAVFRGRTYPSHKNRTRVQYDQFDVLFYKLPSYMCRAAISEAIGAVASYSLKVV